MIVCYSGTPGSCKTLEAVKRVVANLRMGRMVYTNINGMGDLECQEALISLSGLEYDEFYRLFHYVDDKALLKYWEICEDNAFIVIDEVHKLINCRKWNDESNMEFANHASTHRHHGFNILLITQDIQKVDSQVRSLIEWTYFYRKNNFFGSLIKSQFLRYTYTGDQHQGKPLATKTMLIDPRYFHCYKSYTKEVEGEVDFQNHVNILKHPVFFIIPIMILLTCFMFFKKSTFAKGDVFGTSKAVKAVPAKPAAPSAAIIKRPVQGVTSSTYRRPVTGSVGLPPLPPPGPAYGVHSTSLGARPAVPSVPFNRQDKSQYWTYEDAKGVVHMTNVKPRPGSLKVKEFTY